nr:ATP-dependent RNA helicase DHX30-like [Dermacentor andersoni]
MNATNAVGRLRLYARLAQATQAGTRRQLSDTRVFSSDDALGSSDGLSNTADPTESSAASLAGIMDPASVLAALDPIIMKHCGTGHCAASCKVSRDGQELWRARVSVPWPKEMAFEAEASSKKGSLLLASAQMCSALQELGILDSKIFKREPPHEAAGEPCPARTRPYVVTRPCSPGQACALTPSTTFAGQLSNTEAQMMARRNLTTPSQRLKSWTEKRELSRAKSIVHNIYAYVCKLKEDRSLMASYNSNVEQGKVCLWTSTVTVKWPCELAFEGSARNKAEAEALAAAALVRYLVEKGHVDKDLSPKTISDQEVRRQKSQRFAPVPVVLPETFIPDMQEILSDFETVVANAPHLPDDEIEEQAAGGDMVPDNVGSGEKIVHDVMTGQLLRPSSQACGRRDLSLMAKLEKSWNYSYHRARRELPIFSRREDIVSAIHRERVVVICGETGSGKTTQVPQFIFEDYIRGGQGSRCNIVVTQPRRIATISMAKRVALERDEELSDTIGYQVRLKKQLLASRGGILFCTVGILLRHLQQNVKLQGVSHVIVDEVHERDVCTDFLLVLLREVLSINHELKVILMSATIDTEKFSEYFDNAPIIKIAGKTHPVTQFFLEDLVSEEIVTAEVLQKYGSDPVRMVPDVLTYIMEMKPPGAILCFLPGWNEINKVRGELCKRAPAKFHDWILPLHSRLRYEDQQKIFKTPPADVRKVILATNIAETSITVNDVVYVVDTGLQREQRFNPSTGVSLLGTFATSKASVQQRAGRAGRVRPGESYHLYMKGELQSWEQCKRPEIQTTDLTRVVLDCKLFCPTMSVEDVLSLALDPPAPEMIAKAIKDLQVMGLMDANAELTDLGHHVVHFTTAPQLAKATIIGALLGCLDSVVSIVTLLSESSNLFTTRNADGARGSSQKIKLCYDKTGTSDHFALSQIFSHWNQMMPGAEQQSFCQRNDLNPFCLELSKGMGEELVRTLKRVLANSGETSPEQTIKREWGLNFNSRLHHRELALAAMTAGFYPNVLRVLQGKIKKNQVIREGVEFACLDLKLAAVSEDSLLHRVPPQYEHPWLAYYSALQPSEYQPTTVYDCSMITSLHLLLFAGLGVHIIEDYVFDAHAKAPSKTDRGCLLIDEQRLLAFRCSERDADLIWRWRRMLDYMLDLHLSMHQSAELCPEEAFLRRELWPRIVDATSNLLSRHSTGKP